MRRLRPRVDLAATAISPLEVENESPDDLTAVEQVIPTTIPTEIPTQYLPPPTCASPRLPSNVGIKLPDTLQSAIQTFRNRSNNIKTRIASQKLVERYLVERGSCSRLNPTITQDTRVRLFSLDNAALDSVLASEESLNANLHDQISCTVDAIIYDNKQPGQFTPSQRERVRHWFTTIKQIGGESVEGYALRTSFSEDSNLFVMKAPRNPKNDELVHEALVGFYALNKLRHILPNFMYVYGYVKCSPPAFENREPATWCSSSNPAVSFLISENVRNAVPIGDFITKEGVSALDILVVWYQIENALNLAYKYYGYTHYDLHYDNILVRKYSKLVAIPYLGTENKVVGYLVTRYVPYIIDYGYSRITVGGIGFGKIGLESAGIEGDRAFPMYDTYKLLGFLGEKLYTRPRTSQNEGITSLLETLFSFFKDGSLLNRVQRRLSSRADWYSVPNRFRNVTHDDYLTWMQSADILNPVHTDMNELTERGVYPAPINNAIDTCEFYDLITSDKGPDSSLKYCEVVAALNADSTLAPNIKQQAINWLNSHFDASAYFNQTIQGIEEEAMEADLLQSAAIIPQITSNTEIQSADFVARYRAYIFNLLRVKDLTAQVIAYLKASICSLLNQGEYNTNRSRIEALNLRSLQWVDFINRQREILIQNLSFVSSTNWSRMRAPQSVITFWTSEHENLILAV